jgi:predicted ArsR family transcriptional regulator
MVYRLTRRSHGLFQADSNAFTLDLLQSIEEIYGNNAPEKLLYNLFERKTQELKGKVKGDTVEERARSLAALRDEDGHMAQFANEPNEGGPQILECHSPIMNLIEKYEIIGRLEQEMFEKILQTPVRREETRTSGLYEAAFYFAL